MSHGRGIQKEPEGASRMSHGEPCRNSPESLWLVLALVLARSGSVWLALFFLLAFGSFWLVWVSFWLVLVRFDLLLARFGLFRLHNF